MSKNVFIVDDNDANLMMAASALEDEYCVFTMSSAEKMFLFLEKRHADLILLDVEMPGMNGFEALAKLKETPEWKDIPVLFITGWIDERLKADALKAGALDVIGKPIIPSVLQDCVNKRI